MLIMFVFTIALICLFCCNHLVIYQKNRNLFLIVLEMGRSKIKAPTGLVASEGLTSASKITCFLCVF
jgi:hypothetical protein